MCIFLDNYPGRLAFCNITSTNLPTVTAAGGVIANGTQNVILYCICMRIDSNIVVGGTGWFFNGVLITLTQDDGSGNPYSRDNVPSTLTIPSFVSPHDGNYSCGPAGYHFSSASMLGDDITLTLASKYVYTNICMHCYNNNNNYLFVCMFVCR